MKGIKAERRDAKGKISRALRTPSVPTVKDDTPIEHLGPHDRRIIETEKYLEKIEPSVEHLGPHDVLSPEVQQDLENLEKKITFKLEDQDFDWENIQKASLKIFKITHDESCFVRISGKRREGHENEASQFADLTAVIKSVTPEGLNIELPIGTLCLKWNAIHHIHVRDSLIK